MKKKYNLGIKQDREQIRCSRWWSETGGQKSRGANGATWKQINDNRLGDKKWTLS